MNHPPETEFKLRATGAIRTEAVDAVLQQAGASCEAARTEVLDDLYLDDAQGSLQAAGVGLRLRSAGGAFRIQSKAGDGPVDGLFVRAERDAEWPHAEPPQKAQDLPPALRDQVEPFVLDRPLRPTVRLTTERDVRQVALAGAPLCELAIDRVKANANERTATFEEVELEFTVAAEANRKLAAALLAALPLQPASDDKPAHAARALGLTMPAPTPSAPDLHSPAADVVAQLTLTHLAALRRAEVGVRADGDPEHLHQMRVAGRRLRSVVRAFRDLWPEDVAARLLSLLRDGSRGLGEVRDLDVLLASLAASSRDLPDPLRPAAEQGIAWIASTRAAANERMQADLRSDDRRQAAAEIERCLSAIDRATPAAAAPAAADVPARVANAAARVRKLLRALPPELPLAPLHELRIASKRLRYVVEQFPGLPGADHAATVRKLVRLQQALGEVCDHELAARRLLAWIPDVVAASADGPLAAAAFGGLATHHALAARKARKAARKAIAAVDRKRLWRRLLGDARPDANLANERQVDMPPPA